MVTPNVEITGDGLHDRLHFHGKLRLRPLSFFSFFFFMFGFFSTLTSGWRLFFLFGGWQLESWRGETLGPRGLV